MYKRITGVFLAICFMFTCATLQIYRISTTAAYKELADTQKTRHITLCHNRGTIYDCNMNRLVNNSSNRSEYEFLGQSYQYDKLIRYTEYQPASHIIGYIDGGDNGVSGIEKAFNSHLNDTAQNLMLEYFVSAKEEVIKSVEPKIVGDCSAPIGGVKLTIDADIQQICDEALRRSGKSGAVVVLEVGSGAIRAISSYPTVNPYNIKQSLNNAENPFVNRAFSGYNCGSIFKLAVATCALESGISPYDEYECTGSVEVQGGTFSCYNKTAHGVVDMKSALCHSCNTYFINLALKLNREKLLYYCKKFGLSQPKYFADGLFANGGNLPTLNDISQDFNLALFSFGQGKLLTTPIEISELINTVASGGLRYPTYLVEGIVDKDGNLKETREKRYPCRVADEKNANLLRDFMVSVAHEGTGKSGMPENVWGGAKTATAETGIAGDDSNVLQTWYGGFIGKDGIPRYTVAVLVEDGLSGGNTAGPVFYKIASGISKMKFQRDDKSKSVK